MTRYAHLAFTDTVRRVQHERGSAQAVGRQLGQEDPVDVLTDAEAAFIAARDGFYLASVTETGWPYVQFRGGPPGFVHVLDEYTLAYTDVRGNRQYITTGNVRTDDRVALFFMDYARQARLKLFGHATFLGLDERPELTDRVNDRRTDGRPERLVLIHIEGFNWNCSQHITPRYSAVEISALGERLAELEHENRILRNRLSTMD